ncbi:MAG: hypothetical protein DRJ10_09645 [Bacteroidetes bacterium]|nr:MAG: hypothetical protein DRJ10_09645 [Bacteroidota bacterium]
MKYQNHLSLFILTICLFFSGFELQAQSVKVETSNLEIVNNKLIIDYNFIKSKSTQRFNVWVEITKSTGEKINAQSFSGDIGDDLKGGENKQIIWDYNKDGIILNDDITVEVFANITVLGPGMGKALLLSTIFPGLGLSKIDPGKPYWLMGVVGYGLLGGSLLMNKTAVQNYEDYLNTEDPIDSEDLFSRSEENSKLSKTFAYSAIGIWAVNLIWTAVKAKNSQSAITGSLNNKQKVFLYGGLDPKTKSAGFTLKYRF